MRFETLEIERFGSLRDRVLELGGKSAVIFGPNEAGKSQVQGAMRSVLLGFRPGRLERHPARPVEGAEGLAVAAVVRTQGEARRIERVLDGGGERCEGALSLPVRTEVYDDLFVIGPDELSRFHAEPSEILRRLILGDASSGPGVDGLLRAVEKERTRIWRPDRRSKSTQVLSIDGELERIGAELRRARAVEAGLVDLEERVRALGGQLARGEARLAAVDQELERFDTLERMARAVGAAEPPPGVDAAAMATLDSDTVLRAPGPLLAELDAAEDACTHPRERLAAPPVELEDGHRRVLDAAEEIEAVCRLDPECAGLVERADEQRARGKALRIRARAASGGAAATGTPWTPWAVGAVAALSGAGAFLAPGGPVAAGAAAAGAAGAGWVVHRARRGTDPSAGAGQERAELEADAAAADELAGASARRAAEIDAQLGALAQATGLAPLTARGTAARLRQALAEARRAAADAERDRLGREQASRELDGAESRLRAAESAVQEATEQLEVLVPGERSPIRAHDLASEALLRRQRMEGALGEIAADRARWESARRHPEFEAARTAGRFDGAPRAALDAERASLLDTIASLREELTRADERLTTERPVRPVSELRSEELSLRAARGSLLDTHDRLALLSATLREGERRHRAAHAPALLAAASDHLARLTAGRWTRLDLDESGHVTVADGLATWPIAPPLSRGLREQVHLCLRIAALTVAEDGAEPLPLLLDEVFAHQDAGRRGRGLDLLAHVAEERQVVMFSCHRDQAEEAAARLDGELVELTT